jgi:hypothetical protein
MSIAARPSSLWIKWLQVASAVVMLFGLLLVLSPTLARQGFSMLVYASPWHIDTFGVEPVRYIGLAHAVIGGVMIGWGTALYYVTSALLSRGSRQAWNLIALSLSAWFVPDTAYSLLSGYWQNAVLNAAFLLLFALPLLATRASLRNDA